MKRLLLIAAAVLLPFAALVAWGLSALEREPIALPPPAVEPMPLPSAEPAPAPAPIVRAPPPAAAVAPSAAPVEAPREEPPPPAPPTDEATIRQAVVDQLNPAVHLCFLEQNDRLRQPIRISATFDATETGALSNVRVKMKSADPYVVACVQDALEGSVLDKARGLPQGTMRHTFTFDPTGAK